MLRFDLLASEILSYMNENWPLQGENRLQAEVVLEDLLRQIANDAVQECVDKIQARITLLERSGQTAFSRNAANHLKEVMRELKRDTAADPRIVDHEEVDEEEFGFEDDSRRDWEY